MGEPGKDRTPAPDPVGATAPAPRPSRKRPYLMLGGAIGAVGALVAGAVFAGGLFSSAADRPVRERALAQAPVSARAEPTKPAPPSAKRSASPVRTPSLAPRDEAPTRSAPPPSPSSAPPSTARATGSVGPKPSRSSRGPAPGPAPGPTTGAATLSEGDKGPEVAELQGRLAQLHLYTGEADGTYTREVTHAVLRYQWGRGLTSDPPGAYGPRTRRSLESETEEP
ncbi:peptidoglycan-binding protein [Streptomyces sp. WAC 01529]|nr:peptidoglycan-binding protein [Streptomyces sp. WAC 01529]